MGVGLAGQGATASPRPSEHLGFGGLCTLLSLRRQATELALHPSLQDGLAFAQVPRRERGGEPGSSARTISRFVFMARLLGCQLQGARADWRELTEGKGGGKLFPPPPPPLQCVRGIPGCYVVLRLYSTTDLHPWARGKCPETLERPSE